MRWEAEDCSYGNPEFLNEGEEVKSLKVVEFIIEDGNVTGILIEQKDGTLIAVQSKETDEEGCRKELFVSVCQPDEEKE